MMVDDMETRRNEVLSDVAVKTAQLAREFGLSTEIAEQLGAAVADTLATNFGGQVISFPMDYSYQLSQRDREILEKHRRGVHYGRLAKEYNLSERHVRRLIQRAELRDRNLRQRQLFEG